MGKTIDVNLSFSNLLDDKFRVADEKSIQSSSESISDLSASFSKANINALLNMDDCNGIRIYPAAYNNELVMVAYGTNGKNDLVGPDHFCLTSNINGAISINGIPKVGDIDQIPLDTAKKLIAGEGSKANIIDKLNDIRKIDNSAQRLKVLFDDSFFNASDFDDILFEVVDIKLTDISETKRTIIGSLKRDNIFFHRAVSLLPCPPNCGGTYGQK